MWVSIGGLTLDIIGVVLLWRFGLPLNVKRGGVSYYELEGFDPVELAKGQAVRQDFCCRSRPDRRRVLLAGRRSAYVSLLARRLSGRHDSQLTAKGPATLGLMRTQAHSSGRRYWKGRDWRGVRSDS